VYLDGYAVSYTLLWLRRGFLIQVFILRWGSGSSKEDLVATPNFFPVEMFGPEAHFQLESG
jgi:hypothetical protein